MTDSKARKVIVIENTFLPNLVKERIAEALFENLQVSYHIMIHERIQAD